MKHKENTICTIDKIQYIQLQMKEIEHEQKKESALLKENNEVERLYLHFF